MAITTLVCEAHPHLGRAREHEPGEDGDKMCCERPEFTPDGTTLVVGSDPKNSAM
jgi:hypothetical protein